MTPSEVLRSWAPTFAVVFGFLVAASATAQSPQRWTDPTGGWSIDYMTSRWGRADGLPSNGPVLLTLPMQTPPNNETRMCFVEQSYAALSAGADPVEVQGRGAQVGVPEVEAALQRLQLTETRVAHAVVDGVAVALVDGMSRGYRVRGRVFVTPAANSAVLSTISCISIPGMAADRDAEIDTILASLRFSLVQPDFGLSLLAPEVEPSQASANAAALDAQLAEMLAIYREVCFTHFPDQSAVASTMSARQARALSQDEVRGYLKDDPGVGWVLTGDTGQFIITIERPPFNTCAIRTMTAVGFPDSQPYVDFVVDVESGRTVTPIGQLDRTIGNVRTRGRGDQFTGADGSAESLLVIVSTPASGVDPSATNTEVRFARQIVSPHRD